MDNYKIKVNDESESKEAQELFAQLEYIPFEINRVGMLATDNGKIYPDVIGNWDKYDGEELTLPQLRDLVVLHRNDVKDANCTYQPSGTNEVLSGYLTSDDWYYLFTGGSWQKHISTKHEAANKYKPIQPEPEQGLISGADALRALADGKEVEYSVNNSDWELFAESKVFCPSAILSGINQNSQALAFRLKPRTIKLELEIPAPFEPKDGEKYWFIDSTEEEGYRLTHFDNDENDHDVMQFGAWRTEEEIKQVVAALRGIKG